MNRADSALYVVARKEKGLWLVYGIYLAACLPATIINGIMGHFFYFLFFLIFSAVFGFFLVDYLRFPQELITVFDDSVILLPKGKELRLRDIVDMKYSCGVRYTWGSITLITSAGTYVFRYAADCEVTARTLRYMIAMARLKSAEPVKTGSEQ